jgi:MOSC domain-containing protein YiiM
MKLISVNVGMPRTVPSAQGPVSTGIFKEPRSGRIRVGKENLEGDGQADLRVHGGADKAVYAYPVEHYAAWKSDLGREDFRFGQFGENLTVEELLEDEVRIGDRLRIGTALLEVSQPRTPCYKLGIRMGADDFPPRFLTSLRSGFYLRVLEVGEAGAGDPIGLEFRDPAAPSVRELVRLAHFNPDDIMMLRRAVALDALSEGWRRKFEGLLARATRETSS